MTSISKATRRAKREEKIALGIIRFFTALSLIILVWILGYVLVKGFYTRTVKAYPVTPRQEIVFRPEKGNGIFFITHRGVKIRDLAIYDLVTLYSKPRRENWGFYTGQDLPVQAFLFKDESEEMEYLLPDQPPGHLIQVLTPEEMLERVAGTPGGLGFLPAEYEKVVSKDSRVKIIPLRQRSLTVHPSVLEVYNNRALSEITEEELEELLSGKISNWKDLGGRDLPVTLLYREGSEDIAATASALRGVPRPVREGESIMDLLSTLAGSVAVVPYLDIPEDKVGIVQVLRRESGPNLTFSFLLEPPARSGQWGGISYIILNTLFLILFTLLFSTPLGIAAAIYLIEYAKQNTFVDLLRRGTETLAGIPSIIFGIFGHIFFVQILGMGIGFLSGTLTVTMMILPTLIRTTEEALKSVPSAFREGSFALGATKLQTLIRVTLPAASGGILTGILLTLGRTVGETAVLLYTLGSSYDLVRGPSSSARVLSLHLYLLFSEAISFERSFATAAVLIFIILLVNGLTTLLIRGRNRKFGL